MTADEIIGECGQSIVLAIGPAVLDRRILALDIAGFAQAPTESGYAGGECYSRSAVEETNHRHRWLLRARRERPRRRRAAEQRDELAAFHVDFALPLIASPASACHPASLSFTRATSIILPSAIVRSACADASPARTSSTSSSPVNPFANISASVQPSGDAASSSRARRRSGLGPRRRRWGWGIKLAVVAARDLAAQGYHAEPHFSETKSPPPGWGASDGRSARSAIDSHHCGLMLAARITFAHFSLSSTTSFPKSAGEPRTTVPPRSASRASTLGSASAALISLLSLSTISAGVFLGAKRPNHPLAS